MEFINTSTAMGSKTKLEILREVIGRLSRVHLPLLMLVTALAVMGFFLLKGAAGGSWSPYADKQMIRYGLSLIILFTMLAIDSRIFFRLAYVFYFAALIFLALVPVIGEKSLGAQRWLNLGFVTFQPSELMKIALVLALARFYHNRTMQTAQKFTHVWAPLLMIGLPVGLTLIQPDLGTSLLLGFIGVSVMFVAGAPLKFFLLGISLAAAMIPVAWQFLHAYQKARVLTFLNPESDPMGAGYHIMQSKIAIGSAGFWGKGFMGGTQSQLLFLPEKHTDFIFSLLVEDFGMAGALVLMLLYLLLFAVGIAISIRCRSQFNSLVVAGVVVTVFFYAFVNMCMVSGLMPVVGVPLPFISYGGTSMLTLMIGMGFIMSAWADKNLHIPGAGGVGAHR